MSESFKEFNKQIASFILVSAALSVPAAPAYTVENNILADASVAVPAPMVFYAAPQNPVNVKPTVDVVRTPMMFYAAPQNPVNVSPTVDIVKPSIAFYAAPQIPANVIENNVVPLPIPAIEQNTIPVLNESSLNINTINQAQGSINNISVRDTNIGANAVKSSINLSPNIKTDNFVFSEYGNVKIVEPFAHFVFK